MGHARVALHVTPAERKALGFLAGVALLSAGTSAFSGGAGPAPATAETRAALARQIAAADSARRAERGGARGGTGKGGRRALAPRAAARSRRDERAAAASVPATLVDLDAADSAAIERLPRIGPALAGRVVAERAAGGPFGSIRGLERVRGIGPKVAQVVAPHVTFSGTPRPTGAELGRNGRADRGRRRPGRVAAPTPDLPPSGR